MTSDGEGVFNQIKAHCENLGTWNDCFELELSMLANSFALYRSVAAEVNSVGPSIEIGKQGYQQISPEYVVMNKEAQFIIKHSPKFGLNPADVKRIFGADSLNKPKPMSFDTTMKKVG